MFWRAVPGRLTSATPHRGRHFAVRAWVIDKTIVGTVLHVVLDRGLRGNGSAEQER